MRSRFVALGLLAASVPAFGQPPKKWTPGVTEDGQPDLTGLWIDNSATPLERPKALEGRATLTDAEVAELKQRAERLFHAGSGSDFAAGDNVFLAALANPAQFRNPNSTSFADGMTPRVFDNRTSLIVDPPDGRIPALTPAALERQAKRPPAAVAAGTRSPARVQDLNSAIRCITPGVPRIGGRYGAGDFGYYEIFQTPGYFVYFSEVMHEARIIPLDGSPHLPANVRSWTGDSRGHWEGQTLVVDTTNFSEKTNFMGSAENLHLVERFTRVAGNEIRYEVTVDDPTTWTRPWTVMVRLYASKEPMYEYACHEGNQFVTAGILGGPR